MFRISPSIDKELAQAAERLEASFRAESVMAARVFESPTVQVFVRFRSTQPTKLTVLEEFILRAASELDPSPTEGELATAFSLDPVFIRTECGMLTGLNAIHAARLPEIVLTDEGRSFYEKGVIVRPDQDGECTCWIDCCTERIVRVAAGRPDGEPGSDQRRAEALPLRADYHLGDDPARLAAMFPLERMRELLGPLGLHDPEAGREITGVVETRYIDLVGEPVGVFVVRDLVDNRVLFRVLDMRTQRFRRDLEERIQGESVSREIGENLLTAMGVDESVDGQGMEPVPDVVPDYVRTYQSILKGRLVQERSGTPEPRMEAGDSVRQPQPADDQALRKLEYLTDREIRPRFLEAIKGAAQEVIIISPWVKGEVVDDEFLSILSGLAKRRVMVLIGYGFEKEEGDQYVDPRLKKRLYEIRTPEKAPAAALVWLGRSHNKDILIDRRIHMCGSHNWLSYRGDRTPIIRQSIIHMVSDVPLEEQTSYLEGVFLTALHRMWKDYCAYGAEPSVPALCAPAWVALRKESTALQAARELLGSDSGRTGEAADLLRLVCLCLRGRALGPDKDSVVEFLAGLGRMTHEWGDLERGSACAESLAEARGILESDLKRVA